MSELPTSVRAPFTPHARLGVPSRAWPVFAIIAPVYVCTMFYRMAPTVLALDIAADLGLVAADMAMLSGATMLGYGLMQLPSGLLSDAWGGRKTLSLFTLLVGLSTVWFSRSDTFAGVTAARFLTGLGVAATVPCLAILARWFPASLYGRVSSLMFAGGTCGTLLASAPLVAASGLAGWRGTMLVCGLFSLCLAALVWLGVRDEPESTASRSANGGGDEAGRARSVGVGPRELAAGLKQVLTTRAFWPLCVGYSCLLLVYFSFAGLWWGPWLIQGCGLDKAQAGVVLFIGTLASVPAMPLLATLSDKLRSRRAVLVPCAAVALAAMAAMTLTTGRLGLVPLAALAVAFTSACGLSAVALASGKELFPLRMVGTATGCLNTIPALAAALHQKLFGAVLGWRLTERGGDYGAAYGDAMGVNLAFLALALVAFLLIRESYPKD